MAITTCWHRNCFGQSHTTHHVVNRFMFLILKLLYKKYCFWTYYFFVRQRSIAESCFSICGKNVYLLHNVNSVYGLRSEHTTWFWSKILENSYLWSARREFSRKRTWCNPQKQLCEHFQQHFDPLRFKNRNTRNFRNFKEIIPHHDILVTLLVRSRLTPQTKTTSYPYQLQALSCSRFSTSE